MRDIAAMFRTSVGTPFGMHAGSSWVPRQYEWYLSSVGCSAARISHILLTTKASSSALSRSAM